MAAALAEVTAMGVSCGLLGAFVVPRGLTFAGESLSHALLLGAAVALVAGAPTAGGALAGAVVAAVAMSALAGRAGVDEDVAISVVFTGFFALSVIVLSAGGRSEDLEELLFGDVMSADAGDVALACAITTLLAGGLWVFARRLVAIGFDREFAQSIGLRPGRADTLMLVALAVGLSVALRGVGTLLVLSLLVAPAVMARVLAPRAFTTLWLAPALAVLIGVSGLLLARWASLEAGPVIALAGLGAFATALICRPSP